MSSKHALKTLTSNKSINQVSTLLDYTKGYVSKYSAQNIQKPASARQGRHINIPHSRLTSIFLSSSPGAKRARPEGRPLLATTTGHPAVSARRSRIGLPPKRNDRTPLSGHKSHALVADRDDDRDITADLSICPSRTLEALSLLLYFSVPYAAYRKQEAASLRMNGNRDSKT